MTIKFSKDEMADFLRKNGFEVKFKKSKQIRYTKNEGRTYVPDGYFFIHEHYEILKDGKSYESLEKLFEEEMRKKLLNL